MSPNGSGVADLLIVGGGPVGLATAIAARRAGLSATVLERGEPPVDKACGEGILPAGLAALSRLGVKLAGGRPFAGIRYVADGIAARADFPDGERGRGLRRTELWQTLADAATASGAELRFGARVDEIEVGHSPGSPAVLLASGERLRGRFLAGADGLHSKVRAALGTAPAASETVSTGGRFGVTRHFQVDAVDDVVEVHFGDRAEAYLTPLGEAEVGVAILWSGGKGDFDSLLAERFPEALGARFAAAAKLGRDRGAGPFRQRVRARVQGAVALVGDAGGYVDALTGEGLSLGFEQAEALAAAAAQGDLAPYERRARALAALPDRITRAALAIARRPELCRRYLAALSADPRIFAALLGALGARRPLPARAVFTLAGRMAMAKAQPPRAADRRHGAP